MTHHFVVTALVTLFAATGGQAQVQAQAQARLTPGFWIFPQEPALSEDVRTGMCQHGMSLVLEDGSAVSYLAEVGRMTIDSERVCEVDDGFSACTTRLYSDAGFEDFPTTTEFQRDARGNLMAVSTNIATGAFNRSYPQTCPPVAVRDFMVGWLAPRAEG